MNDLLMLSNRLYVLEILLLQKNIIDPDHYFEVLEKFIQVLPDVQLSEESHELDHEISQIGNLMEQLQVHKDYLKRALNQ